MHIELKIYNSNSESRYYSFVVKKMSKKWVHEIYGKYCEDEYYFAKKTRNNPYGNTWIIKTEKGTWDYCQVDKIKEEIKYNLSDKILGVVY